MDQRILSSQEMLYFFDASRKLEAFEECRIIRRFTTEHRVSPTDRDTYPISVRLGSDQISEWKQHRWKTLVSSNDSYIVTICIQLQYISLKPWHRCVINCSDASSDNSGDRFSRPRVCFSQCLERQFFVARYGNINARVSVLKFKTVAVTVVQKA